MTALTRPRTLSPLTAALGALGALLLSLLLAGQAHAQVMLSGSLEVSNDRFRPVGVFVDGQRLGRVAPNSRAVFEQIPNGLRVVGLKHKRGEATYQKVRVLPHAVARVRVAPLLGSAKIRNKSGVDLRLELDGRSLGVLRQGRAIETGHLPAGSHRLVAHVLHPEARRRHKRITREFHIRPGERERIRIGKWMGTLSVTNTSHRRAAVLIDGRRVGRLRAGATATYEVAPGRHKVELKRRWRTLAKERVRVASGRDRHVRPAIAWTGDVQITNNFRRHITVIIDGKRLGKVRPGATQIFRGLSPGAHTVTAMMRHGRRVTKHVRVRDGRTSTVAFARPGHGPYHNKGHGHGHGHKGSLAYR